MSPQCSTKSGASRAMAAYTRLSRSARPPGGRPTCVSVTRANRRLMRHPPLLLVLDLARLVDAQTVVTSKLDRSQGVKLACHDKHALQEEVCRAVVSRSQDQ